MSMQLSEMWFYPIKSCRGIALESAQLDAFGLVGDRRWMLVDSNGHMVTQRECAQMCLIQVELGVDSLLPGLVVHAPSMPSLVISPPNGKQRLQVQVWQDVCQAWLLEESVHQWFSEFLQRDVRLVWFPEEGQRQVDLAYARPGEQVAFADGFPLLLIAQASLDDLNSRLESPIEMARFRPNLVVSGCDAFEEDRHNAIQIGELIFPIVKPCARCSMPTIDLNTAKRGREPTNTMSHYRKREGELFFGQNLLAPNLGRLQLGMSAKWLAFHGKFLKN